MGSRFHLRSNIAAVAFVLALVGTMRGAVASDHPGLPVPPARAAFYSIWQKEALSGQTRDAAEHYVRLYSSGGLTPVPAAVKGAAVKGAAVAGESGVMLTRIRAAYRAGICFESLRNKTRALRAYRWLDRAYEQLERRVTSRDLAGCRAVTAARPLRDRARLRLRRLDEDIPPPVLAEGGILEVLDQARTEDQSRGTLLEQVRQAVLEQRRLRRATDDLIDDLELRGVVLRFDERRLDVEEAARQFEQLVPSVARLTAEWRATLAASFREHALEYVAGGRLDRARRKCLCAIIVGSQLGSDEGDSAWVRDARDLLSRIDRDDSSERLIAGASAELRRQDGERRARLRQVVRPHLFQEARLERGDRALRKIFRAHEELMSTGQRRTADPELSSFEDIVRLRAAERAGSRFEDEVRAALADSRERTRELQRLSIELVEGFVATQLRDASAVYDSAGRERQIEMVSALVHQHGAEIVAADRAAADGKTLQHDLARHRIGRLRRWFPRWSSILPALPAMGGTRDLQGDGPRGER